MYKIKKYKTKAIQKKNILVKQKFDSKKIKKADKKPISWIVNKTVKPEKSMIAGYTVNCEARWEYVWATDSWSCEVGGTLPKVSILSQYCILTSIALQERQAW